MAWTSRDVVNRVQRLVRPAKVGHAGTLDPLADGVLVVCLGPATRLMQYVQQMPKTYRATFLLGQTSPSHDLETEVSPVVAAPVPTDAQLESALASFVGQVQQRPPSYSALRVDGTRAYHLARGGAEVNLAPRTVTIYNLTVERYQFPQLVLDICCGRGTYIRSLGRDLGEALGCGALLTALTRTAVGDYVLAEAVSAEKLSREAIQQNLQSPLTAVGELPQLELSDQQVADIRHGRFVPATELSLAPARGGLVDPEPGQWAGVDGQGRLVAILREVRPGMLGPLRNFSQSL